MTLGGQPMHSAHPTFLDISPQISKYSRRIGTDLRSESDRPTAYVFVFICTGELMKDVPSLMTI